MRRRTVKDKEWLRSSSGNVVYCGANVVMENGELGGVHTADSWVHCNVKRLAFTQRNCFRCNREAMSRKTAPQKKNYKSLDRF